LYGSSLKKVPCRSSIEFPLQSSIESQKNPQSADGPTSPALSRFSSNFVPEKSQPKWSQEKKEKKERNAEVELTPFEIEEHKIDADENKTLLGAGEDRSRSMNELHSINDDGDEPMDM
jgi:hypothetical protein